MMAKKYRYVVSLLLIFALLVQSAPAVFAGSLSPLDSLNVAKGEESISDVLEILGDPELGVTLPNGYKYWSEDLKESLAENVIYTTSEDFQNVTQVQKIVDLASFPFYMFNNLELSSIENNLNEFFTKLQEIQTYFPNNADLNSYYQVGNAYTMMSAVDKHIFAYRTKLYYMRDQPQTAQLMQLLSASFSVYLPINEITTPNIMYDVLTDLRSLQTESEQYNNDFINTDFPMDNFKLNLDKFDLPLPYEKFQALSQWMIDKRPANGYADYAAIQETFDLFFAPPAPSVTADDTTNTIVGADSTMEYSVDSGDNWLTYNPAAAPVFTGNVTVWVRVKANEDIPAGNKTVLTFTQNVDLTPAAPSVTANDTTNTIVGADSTMEYSVDSGDNWLNYNPAVAPVFTGNVTVWVRVKAIEDIPAGNKTILTFTQNTDPVPPSSGGSGGSTPSTPSTTTPSSNTENIVVDVNGGDGTKLAQTPITRTTDSKGVVKDHVSMSESIAKDTVEKAKQLGLDKARIVIPDTKDKVSEIVVEVPKAALQQLNNGKLNLEIATDNGVISIPTTSIVDFNQDLYFRVVPLKLEAQKQELEERAKKEKLIRNVVQNQTVKVLGRPMEIETNMQSREVSIVLPLKSGLPTDPAERQKVLDNLAVYIEHSDGTKELLQGKLVKMTSGSEGIEFTVKKFSTFTVVYLDGWKDKQHSPYIKGYGDGFHPGAFVTRAEMAAMLARNLSAPETLTGSGSYVDVSAKHWANAEIKQTGNAGIMLGTDPSHFDPEGSITRAQMAVISYRWMKQKCAEGAAAVEVCSSLTNLSKAGYNDVGASHWAADAIAYMKSANIMVGYESNAFRPEEKLTRAEAVKVLNRLFNRTPLTGVETATFTDVPTTHWAYAEIESAAR